METFSKKSVDELGEWLKIENFSEKTVDLFKENEIDGEAFLLLTDEQMRVLVKAIGAQMKLIKRRDQLKANASTSKQVNFQCADNTPHLLPERDTAVDDTSEVSHYEDDVEIETSSEELDTSHSELKVTVSPKEPNVSPQEICTLKGESSTLSEQGEPKRLKIDTGATIVSAWTRIASKKKQELGLPMPFELPHNFQPHIQAGLDAENLTGKARGKFITSIAESIYRYKSYPTREEYDHVAHQIVKKWKFLGTRTGHGYLVEALKERMAYLRKPDCQKRGKGKQEVKISNPTCPTMPSSPVVLKPPSEDRASHNRHLKRLKSECRNVQPNRQITQDLTKRMFPFRRQDILEGKITTDEIFSIYPTLKSSEEIVREFDRIKGTGASTVFNEKWGEMVPEIIKLARQEHDNYRIQDKLKDMTTDTLPEDGQSILALYCLYYLLPDTRVRPDHGRVLTLIEEGENVKEALKTLPTAQPCIIVRGQLHEIVEAVLVVEKKIVTTFNPKNASLILLGAFYTFFLHYTEGCINFYTFFEVVFFNKKKPTKMTRLSSIIARLTSCREY